MKNSTCKLNGIKCNVPRHTSRKSACLSEIFETPTSRGAPLQHMLISTLAPLYCAETHVQGEQEQAMAQLQQNALSDTMPELRRALCRRRCSLGQLVRALKLGPSSSLLFKLANRHHPVLMMKRKSRDAVPLETPSTDWARQFVWRYSTAPESRRALRIEGASSLGSL
jgi:hypothetical protein